MAKKNLFVKVVLYVVVALLLLSLIAPAIFSQTASQFRQEKLLNGLKLYMRPDPSADKVEIRVRVNAGSAFDPQGREGVMYMLARNLFPTPASIEYFVEDLEGSFDLNVDHDMIEVRATGKKEDFLAMLETIADAFSKPPIDRETTDRLRSEQMQLVATAAADHQKVVDALVLSRLYGKFPYGRPVIGTTESVKQIVYADLVDAKTKFLSADNSVVTIEGGFDRSLGLRAAKRFFGGWAKADRKVPATFRQPEDPERPLEMIQSNENAGALRFAIRTAGRSSKDFAATEVFSVILSDRLKSRVPVERREQVNVSYDANLLFGTLLVSISMGEPVAGAGDRVDADQLLSKALNDPVSDAEFDLARSKAATAWRSRSVADMLLDNETYKTGAADVDRRAFDDLKAVDARPVFARIASSPSVTIVVTKKTDQ